MRHSVKNVLLLAALLIMPMTTAWAEPINIDIGTPPVIVIKHSMTQRYSRLVRMYDAGIIGLGNDGLLQKRETSKQLTLTQRQIAEKLIDHDNNDRQALVYALAYNQGGEARLPEIRAALLKRWQEQFKSGWWMQDRAGNWFQKP
jgi:hypothetical protein